MNTALEILAVGARTPVGLRAETTAAALRAGIARTREFPFVTAAGQPVIVASDPQLADDCLAAERLAPMIHSVIDEVLHKLGTAAARVPTVVWLALPVERPGLTAADFVALERKVASWLAASGRTCEVRRIAEGRASVMRVLELIHAWPAHADEVVHLVAAVDSYLDANTFCWLEGQRRFAQADTRGGFIPGEAAICLAITSRAMRTHLRHNSLATIAGVGTAQETLLADSDSGSFGRGLHEAVARAAEGLALPGDAAALVYADINGERYRSEEWAFFAMRMPAVMRSLEYEAPMDLCGDVGAAFAPLACVLAAEALTRRKAPGPRCLITAGSDSGLRGAIVVQEAAPS